MIVTVRRTGVFRRWFDRLRDEGAKQRIVRRLARLSQGNFGDVRSLKGGLYELRIDYGPGYRLYYIRQGAAVVLLLAGGDKRSQPADIELARSIAKELSE